LLDAELLTQVYVELCGGRQIGLMLAEEAATASAADLATATTTAVPRISRPARPHSANEAELARHAAFIQKLVDPLWELLPAAG